MRNAMAFFTDGRAAFGYLEEALDGTEKSIDIQMFIWRDDPLGRRLLERVEALADRGVLINIRKDLMGVVFELAEESRGSLLHDRIPLRLRLQALMLHRTYPMVGKPRHCSLGDPYRIKRLNRQQLKLSGEKVLNDHSKCIVIDNKELIISGMNFEEKEYSTDLLGRRYFDFMLSVDSEEVVKKFREGIDTIHRPLNEQTDALDFIRNSDKGYHIREGLIDRLSQAQQRLDIIMAYIGHKEVTEVLVRQCQGGVEVNLYIPAKANLQNDLNLRSAAELLKRTDGNVNIYLCSQMIHGKLIMVDGDYITFGSANLNRQSLEVLHETNVGFFSRSYGMEVTVIGAIQHIQEQSVKIQEDSALEYSRFRAYLESLV